MSSLQEKMERAEMSIDVQSSSRLPREIRRMVHRVVPGAKRVKRARQPDSMMDQVWYECSAVSLIQRIVCIFLLPGYQAFCLLNFYF